MKIQTIDHFSPHLDTVKKLWRTNSATLGFFPDGAFDDYAKQGNIIIALNRKNECIGYLLYRTSRNKISIVHLCIDNHWQGNGIARELFEYLEKIPQIFMGLVLSVGVILKLIKCGRN